MQLINVFRSFAVVGLLSSCQAKKCTQYTEVRYSFINMTAAAQSLVVDVYENGVVKTKAVELTSTSNPQETTLGSYYYEKDPTYHGKIDFHPEDAQCSALDVRSEPMQFNDPGLTSLKLCFGEGYVGEAQNIYLVNGSSICPNGSAALQRW